MVNWEPGGEKLLFHFVLWPVKISFTLHRSWSHWLAVTPTKRQSRGSSKSETLENTHSSLTTLSPGQSLFGSYVRLCVIADKPLRLYGPENYTWSKCSSVFLVNQVHLEESAVSSESRQACGVRWDGPPLNVLENRSSRCKTDLWNILDVYARAHGVRVYWRSAALIKGCGFQNMSQLAAQT